ncbi:MAG: N-6 DNA methylase [Planctomycetaceae bacterium]|nr:N-6 DNA methylase [Planctomycetaceae bacterium]
MSQSIQIYYSEIEKASRYSGSEKETALRTAFVNLINEYAKSNDLVLVPELSTESQGDETLTVIPDGTLKDILRQDWGYWEAKDTDDNLDEEIRKKFNLGYPNDNILFEDTQTAVLFQSGKEVLRCTISDEKKLDYLLKAFVKYDKPDVKDFRKALEFFKQDVPSAVKTVRELIKKAEHDNPEFQKLSAGFLELCRVQINPEISFNEIREMLVQHILTEDIFNRIFSDNQFHRENNIARELEKVCNTFFFGEVKRKTMHRIKYYYDALTAAASRVARHHEKQKILKVIYEAFYRSYNPAAADRLGVIYTPDEIVQFMIQAADYLLPLHFNCYLEHENVEILDPCTGTGTFVCALINHIRKVKLEQKYRNEIHANEIAILPYYISNLNIELTYSQKMNDYVSFENLVFADTLDRMSAGYEQPNLGFMEENVRRINRQNKRTISVIIGNPPYNANQQNENDNNPNKKYPVIDKRMKETFIKKGTAQKTKMYDPLFRFCRWAFDRVADDGIVAFVMNRIFIDGRGFDGFRRTLEEEFDAVYVIDLGGDTRRENRTSVGNVFGIQLGIAILFCIKKKERDNAHCKIHYLAVNDVWNRDKKLQWLSQQKMRDVLKECDVVRPDKQCRWIDIVPKSDFETFLPLCSRNVKSGKFSEAIFENFSLGTTSNRDDWVYDIDLDNLKRKVRFFVSTYNKELITGVQTQTIKYTRDLKKRFAKGKRLQVNRQEFRVCHYRCFSKRFIYFAQELNEMRYLTLSLFPNRDSENQVIVVNQNAGQTFGVLASDTLVDLHFNGDALCLPFYQYGKHKQPTDNITDWALKQFREYYKNKRITKKQIFYYVYAVLNNPQYCKKYEINLKRDYPRIPFYADFTEWTAVGERLLKLHVGYEKVKPYPLTVVNSQSPVKHPKTQLKANPSAGEIVLDENTKLCDIPSEAWDYKIGKRSALEWVLDQYKEKKIKDKTVAAKFNAYRFADYMEHVIDLLRRICTVSIETMKIQSEMK